MTERIEESQSPAALHAALFAPSGSILLADGVSPVYVQEQLGHATIELTVSTYGRWLKKKAPARSIGSIVSPVLRMVAKW